MARVVYHPDRQGNSSGPFSPLAGVTVRRAHAERTYRRILRLDGTVAATEEREVLTLDADGEGYSLCDARRIARLPTTAPGRLWYALKHCALVLFDCAAIAIGSVLAYSLAYACTSSVGWGLAGIGAFLLYCTWLRTHA